MKFSCSFYLGESVHLYRENTDFYHINMTDVLNYILKGTGKQSQFFSFFILTFLGAMYLYKRPLPSFCPFTPSQLYVVPDLQVSNSSSSIKPSRSGSSYLALSQPSSLTFEDYESYLIKKILGIFGTFRSCFTSNFQQKIPITYCILIL